MSANQGESGGQRKRGRAAVCWEKAIENPHARSPIQPDELLKSKMTFCNNTLYSGKV